MIFKKLIYSQFMVYQLFCPHVPLLFYRDNGRITQYMG